MKTESTLMEPNKALVKDAEVEDVEVHLYRLLIGSLMYLTASRPDITFAICACARSLLISWQKVLWIQNQMLDYGFNLMSTKIYIDNEIQQKSDGIFISQEIYVADLLKMFDFTTVKTASIPMEPNKALVKDAEAEDRKHKPRRRQREVTEVPHTKPQAEERVPIPSHDLLPSGGCIQTWKIAEIDANEDLFLIDKTAQDKEMIKDQDLFVVHDVDGDEVFMDVTTAAKPKAKGVTIQEPSEFRTTSPLQPSQPPQARNKEQESAKKQKLDEQEQAKVADDDTTELKRCLQIVLEGDDDVAIEETPLSSKSPTIFDYKIYREWKKSYFKIIKANRNSENYLTFRTMFRNFNREDLEVLRSIVKERFKKIKPVDDMDNLLF
nr:hypothetical protein [Tanacetum cinerariifolium]